MAKRLLALAGLLLAGLPAAALAHRTATTAERIAILAAVVKQHYVSSQQAACMAVTVSTASSDYAAVTFPAKLSNACLQVAANGIVVTHRTSIGWRVLADGSDWPASALPGVPAAVKYDLGVGPAPTVGGAFVGEWLGHDRTLTVTTSGIGHESVYDSCCQRGYTIGFQISDATGSSSDAAADIRLTAVRIYDRSDFPHGVPHVGEAGKLRLTHGKITELITGSTYCGDNAPAFACGA